MNRVAPVAERRPAEEISAGNLNTVHRILFGLFLAAFGLAWAATLFPIAWLGEPEGSLTGLVRATPATSLVSLSRQLPGQNVLLAAAIIALIGSAAHWVGAVTGIPFGPFEYTDTAGPKFFSTLPWALPFIWIIAILNSRGVARLVLRPWRKTRAYGLWIMGLSSTLSLLLNFGLEPFASRI